MKNNDYSRLILREAAGFFWLVDAAQSGRPYIPPLRMNEAAAGIWRSLSLGKTPEETAAGLAETGEVTAEEALEDVKAVIDMAAKEMTKRR